MLKVATTSIMDAMVSVRMAAFAVLFLTSSAFGQTPQPFPRPGTTPAPARPVTPPPQTPAQTPAPTTQAQPAPAGDPNPATLGVPLYPSAQFIASYDAGRGQRYYLYGVTASFAELVTYYRTQLRERGTLVFEEPPMHMFEIGRFRDETMAFPPGVTIKDWTAGGSQGYPNPKRGAQPARFASVIMIVPPPAAAPAAR